MTFYSDNQAGIQAIGAFKPAPGHYIVDLFLKLIGRIRRKFPHCTISVQWILGHEGIQGNEAADKTAKKAATDGSSHDSCLPAALRSRYTLPASKSALKQHFYADLKTQNEISFAKSSRCEALC